jgi:hypothetical protein
MEPAESTLATNNHSFKAPNPRGPKNYLKKDSDKSAEAHSSSQPSQYNKRNKRRRRPYYRNSQRTTDSRLKADAQEFTPSYSFDLAAPQFIPSEDVYSLQATSAEFVPSESNERIIENISSLS